MLFAPLKKKVLRKIIQASEWEAAKLRIFQQFYKDMIDLEDLPEAQKNDYSIKSKTAGEQAEFNEKVVRYMKPLL